MLKVEEVERLEHVVPGPKSAELLEKWRRHEAQTTTWQAPVVWDHARGMVVTDVDGQEYLDWTSGVLVTNVGHCHPRHVEAVQRAAERLMNSYDFPTPERVTLAEKVNGITPPHLDQCFFLTTGSEATEAAMRIAKRFTGKFEIISFHGAFHGRTYGAMSAAGTTAPKKRFGPTMPGAIQVPYPYCYRCPLSLKPDSCGFACLDLVKSQVNASSTGSLAATIIEPYLGAAGFIFPPDGYLKTLEQWVEDQGMLLILDEVQSSFGRTGKMFAMEWEDLKPAIVPMAKGMGSGIPTAGIALESRVGKCLGQGELSSTCGGNPVSSAAAAAVIDIIHDEGLVENSRRMGEIMKARLLDIQERCRILGDVRGKGLIIGLEIVTNKATKEPSRELTREIILRAARKGLLIGSVGPFGNVIRVAPPLIINEEQAHRSLDIMEEVLLSVTP